jgi:hypothetical protein
MPNRHRSPQQWSTSLINQLTVSWLVPSVLARTNILRPEMIPHHKDRNILCDPGIKEETSQFQSLLPHWPYSHVNAYYSSQNQLLLRIFFSSR